MITSLHATMPPAMNSAIVDEHLTRRVVVDGKVIGKMHAIPVRYVLALEGKHVTMHAKKDCYPSNSHKTTP